MSWAWWRWLLAEACFLGAWVLVLTAVAVGLMVLDAAVQR